MEITQHAKYNCTFCGKVTVKRTNVGIWNCRACGKTVAGGGSFPPPPQPLPLRLSRGMPFFPLASRQMEGAFHLAGGLRERLARHHGKTFILTRPRQPTPWPPLPLPPCAQHSVVSVRSPRFKRNDNTNGVENGLVISAHFCLGVREKRFGRMHTTQRVSDRRFWSPGSESIGKGWNPRGDSLHQ